MKLINRLADRVLDRIAPESSAKASTPITCGWVPCHKPGCQMHCCNGSCGPCACID